MNKIKRISLYFRVLFQIIFVVIVPLQILFWAAAPYPLHWEGLSFDIIPKAYQTVIPSVLTLETKFFGFLVSSLPTVVELFALYFLIKLFRLYEQGEIFSLNNVHYIRNVGYALLIEQLVNPISQGLLGFVLSWHQKKGLIAVSLSGTDASILLIALMILLISWIMAEGYKLREDQQLTI